jgi:hypothetical protein
MGKKAKEHRKKVAKRNAKINQKKSAMQKAFDMLLQNQMQKLTGDEEMNVDFSGKPLNFEVVDKITEETESDLKEENQ